MLQEGERTQLSATNGDIKRDVCAMRRGYLYDMLATARLLSREPSAEYCSMHTVPFRFKVALPMPFPVDEDNYKDMHIIMDRYNRARYASMDELGFAGLLKNATLEAVEVLHGDSLGERAAADAMAASQYMPEACAVTTRKMTAAIPPLRQSSISRTAAAPRVVVRQKVHVFFRGDVRLEATRVEDTMLSSEYLDWFDDAACPLGRGAHATIKDSIAAAGRTFGARPLVSRFCRLGDSQPNSTSLSVGSVNFVSTASGTAHAVCCRSADDREAFIMKTSYAEAKSYLEAVIRPALAAAVVDRYGLRMSPVVLPTQSLKKEYARVCIPDEYLRQLASYGSSTL